MQFFRYYSQLVIGSGCLLSRESEWNDLLLTTAALLSHLQPPTQTINTTLFIEILKMGDMTLPRYILIKTVNCAIPLGIVLITQDLGAIFNFIGSYSTCMTAFVFPALLYLAAYKVEFRDILNSWDNKSNTCPVTSIWGRICSLKNFYLPCLLLVYGGFIFVTGMISLSQ